MNNKNRILTFLISLLIITFSFSGCKSIDSSASQLTNLQKNNLLVHYIDVGQGDCILVQVNGKNLLIDSGTGESKDKVVAYLRKQGVKKLDYVVATHPHEDHIGGMSNVIKNLQIGSFYAPKKTANTKVFEDMISALNGKKIISAKAGVKLDMGENTTCEMLAPNSSSYEDINNYSAVIKLTYKNNKFLFMGDAQKLSEQEIISSNADLACDVLKVGHHGSSTSTSKEFLDKASPKIAVISCGKNNQFGHPHKETITELKNKKIITYRTDIEGTIVLVSNGINIQKQ